MWVIIELIIDLHVAKIVGAISKRICTFVWVNNDWLEICIYEKKRDEI